MQSASDPPFIVGPKGDSGKAPENPSMPRGRTTSETKPDKPDAGRGAGALAIYRVLRLALGLAAPGAAGGAPPAPPAPMCSPSLEAACDAYAGGRLDEAARDFRVAAADAASPAFARGLALFGLSRVALEKGDRAGALDILARMAARGDLEQAHRDMARRLAGEVERAQRGLPARDPAAYRAPLPVLGEPGAVFHVAARRGAAGDGSEASPFATLREARDGVRALRRSGGGRLPGGGVRVVVHGGPYPVTQTLELSAGDSGAPGAPVVYEAAEGEAAVLTGGVRLRGWGPVSDPAARAEWDPAVRARVLECDLAAQGVADWGDPTALRASPQLYFRGEPQPLARWPKRGFMTIVQTLGSQPVMSNGAADGCLDGRFRYGDERESLWTHEPDVRLLGYWYWDWSDEFQRVESIDPQTRVMTLARPYAAYGYRSGQRYRAVNVRSEIHDPGEWYLDRRSGRLYWLPPAGADPVRAAAELSCFARPFVAISGAHDVILLGLVMQEGRGDAIHVDGGADCLVAGCTIRRFGGDAVVIRGGVGHGVFGCLIHTMGCGGVDASCGDRSTLESGHLFVEDCTVRDISRAKRTYTPAVHLSGCGGRIAHNLFEGMPSSAMRVDGNDHLVELNVVRHVVQESDDQGGVDMWGNPLYRGNVYRWNYFADIDGGTRVGAAAVRLDDLVSGTAVYGNVFEDCGARLFGAVQVNGGQANLVDGNLFVGCRAGISFSPFGPKRWLDSMGPFLTQAASPLYLARYPALLRIREDVDVNYACRNVFSRCGEPLLNDQGGCRAALDAVTRAEMGPRVLSDEAALRADPVLRRLLLDPIPLGEMGPYRHPWRVRSEAD